MLISQDQLQKFKAANTRAIEMPDGSKRDVMMPPDHWDNLEFLRIVEGIKQQDIAELALEEMGLQGATFNEAFRGVLSHLVNRWY